MVPVIAWIYSLVFRCKDPRYSVIYVALYLKDVTAFVAVCAHCLAAIVNEHLHKGY